MHVEGSTITEWEDLKVCDWCGGRFEKGFDGVRKKRIPPSYFCSYECSLASGYYRTLLYGVVFVFGSFLLLVGWLVFPVLVEDAFQFPILFGFLLFGQVLGWPMMWCAKDSRTHRRTTPQDSKRGQMVGELHEHHNP
ncbi:MAG: hypothetical protein ACFFE2_17215 [Candidatus Thorarchaeota archaeon]